MAKINQNTTDLQSLLDKVNELPSAGGGGGSDPVLQDKTVTPTTSKQTITADSGYDGLDTVTVNAMPTATQATPSITVSSAGLITASSTQTAGYVASGTKSATKQLTIQAAQTITPGTSNKTIASGRYLTGTQTIKGDANLVAENIKQGVTIFGVTGTHAGGENLESVISQQEALITELSTALDNKASEGSGGTIETCAVTVSPGMAATIVYQTVDGAGHIVATSVFTQGAYLSDLVVVCGTSVSIDYGTISTTEAMYTPGAPCTLLSRTNHAFNIAVTASAGESVYITIGFI